MPPLSENGRPTGSNDYRINFFRPQPGFMRSEVIYIWIALAGWAILTFGFQYLLVAQQLDPTGRGPLTELTLFGFPFHYWFSGQFLIVWFIVLFFLFNFMVDRLSERYHKRR